LYKLKYWRSSLDSMVYINFPFYLSAINRIFPGTFEIYFVYAS